MRATPPYPQRVFMQQRHVRGLRMELRAQSKAGQRIVEAPEGSQPDAQGVGTVMAASAT